MLSIRLERGFDHAWQWDLNHRLILDGCNSGIEVHFSSCYSENALVTETYADGELVFANVPNIMLTKAADISVFVYIDDQVAHSALISVFERPKPEDYIYTETEVKRFEDLERRLNELEKSTLPGGGGLTITDDGMGHITISSGGTSTIVDDGAGHITFTAEDYKELESLETPNGVYNSFPDKLARNELKGKVPVPDKPVEGYYLKIKAVNGDGTFTVEAVPAPTGGGELPATAKFETLAIGADDAEGVYIQSGGTAEAPALVLYGEHGDEAVRLMNLARAVDDSDAPNLAQVREMVGNGSGENLGLSVETISNDIEVVGVGSISLDYSEVTLSAGQTMMLACMVSPSNATNTAIRWESENESVATVDNGLVTAVGAGSTAITAISEDNPSARATCAVSVAAGENTVYFASLAMQDGMYKTDGSLNTGIHGHCIIPYFEGMEIHTVQSGMFEGNGYKPFFVRSKSTGALTAVAGYSSEPCSDFPKYQSTYSHFWVTLNGYSPDEVEVVVNAHKATDVGSDTVSNYKDYYKYSLAG